MKSTEKNSPPCPSWTWKPISPNKENHSESACQSETLANGFKMIAARVRGKKHKHEGTNCDDWFEIARSGEWGIIAVSDGAGSKLFSRVGARVACEAAVNYLVNKLQQHKITPRQTWTVDTFARNKKCQFKEQDIESTQVLLHEAIQVAYHAVEKAYHVRDPLKDYYKALGNRDLSISDFSATLLLVIHTTVECKNAPYSFVLACQVGDGISAAIYKNKAFTCLLGAVEKNDFYGETEFLTSSRRKLERDYLSAKTFPFFSPMLALMVMTDGVSDDYFPPDKGMLQLFGDLVLNGIIPVAAFSALSEDQVEILKQRKNEYRVIEKRITEKGALPTLICSVSDYAKIINLSIEELVAAPALLVAGMPEGVCDSTLESRLQAWLDAYHVRGSSDDRTLVVLFDAMPLCLE